MAGNIIAPLKGADQAILRRRIAARERMRRWRAGNREKVSAAAIEYRRTNPEKVAAALAKYRAAHRVRLAEEARARRQADPGKIRAIEAAYRSRNPQNVVAASLRWAKHNPLKVRIRESGRRAKKRAAPGSYTPDDVLRIGELQHWRCAYCRTPIRRKFHVDHILALNAGGSNEPRNLQLTCARCNCRKRDKHPLKFSRELGLLV